MTVDKSAIRDAATVIVLRNRFDNPQVLMGQRGAKAAFMPNKFVFPGGAVDADDYAITLQTPLQKRCADRLQEDLRPETRPDVTTALPVAAIRELWEETGLVLGSKAAWSTPPRDWADYAATGHRPSAEALQFVFRAITPPGRPRRFDARFFLLDAAALSGDIDDFSAASDELSHLQWVPLAQARQFDLPFITEVVLAEIAGYIHDLAPPATIPFFKNDDEAGYFKRLNGRPPRKDDLGA
ncbi:NUDIX hydrolase [Cognatishimia sp. SS12]|uniref:NUDIX hydrolase n=1 Tax=Cognatishimia sp. SS12 TaxID=2979465 RepID=UPI00232AF12C|nr:NUDIX hydrolase [Cognatishimia sp. SS12]MDC0736684.1 NUDIX hydrolase [Cognatishimia sp. SS12]